MFDRYEYQRSAIVFFTFNVEKVLSVMSRRFIDMIKTSRYRVPCYFLTRFYQKSLDTLKAINNQFLRHYDGSDMKEMK